jgi:predicted nucleotidyltransferase
MRDLVGILFHSGRGRRKRAEARRVRERRGFFLGRDSWLPFSYNRDVTRCLPTSSTKSAFREQAIGMEEDMPLAELVRARREDILRTASHYGAYHVRVFGSVARGEADEQSDLDLLVDLEAGRSLFDLGGLLTDLEELLGCAVDVVTEEGLRDRIKTRVLREAIPL